jgi:Fe-S cluster assembly iron-binding protein IscA
MIMLTEKALHRLTEVVAERKASCVRVPVGRG